jgi:hypothetical protein
MKSTIRMYVVVVPRASTLNWPIGIHEEQAAQTYFGAVYFKRKYAKEMADQWPGSRVVRVRLTEAVPHV